jgi:thymidylate kinase
VKIAIVGTHGAGKTTLSYLLASEYKRKGKNVKIIQEVARNCPFKINEGMTAETSIWIYLEHQRKELEAESKFEIVICDRSVYDSFIYGEVKKVLLSCSEELKGFYLKLESAALYSLYSYDRIILIDPDIPMEVDNTRSDDPIFQYEVKNCFHNKLKDFGNLIKISSSVIFNKEYVWNCCH